MSNYSTHDMPIKARNRGWWIALPILFLALGSGYWLLGEFISLESLAARESALRQWQHESPWFVIAVAFSIYVAVTGLSLPGASVLTLVCGWYFGFWQGLVIVSFASTTGATIAFLLSRYLFREWVEAKLSLQWAAVNEAFDREGAFYLFSLRLLFAIPFFVVNALMGLTKIRALTFWWVSQLGMLPATAAFVYAGSTVPSLRSLALGGVGQVISGPLLLAFVILGILPLVIKRLLSRFRT